MIFRPMVPAIRYPLVAVRSARGRPELIKTCSSPVGAHKIPNSRFQPIAIPKPG